MIIPTGLTDGNGADMVMWHSVALLLLTFADIVRQAAAAFFMGRQPTPTLHGHCVDGGGQGSLLQQKPGGPWRSEANWVN